MINFNDAIKNHSDEMIKKIIEWVIHTKNVDIRFNCFEEDQWSILTYYQTEEDKEWSLRLHLNNVYDLYVGYYDKADEFFEMTYQLNEKEIETIPTILKKLMKRVLDDEKDICVNGNFILK